MKRSKNNYDALSLMNVDVEEGDEEVEHEKTLALVELHDAAKELTQAKVHEEKTQKHCSFCTEEMVLKHVQSMLETSVPSKRYSWTL